MHCRDKLFLTTNKLDVNLGHVAESFTVGNPVSSEAIEPMLVILRNELKGTGRKILSLNNTVSKDHGKNVSTMNISISIDQLCLQVN